MARSCSGARCASARGQPVELPLRGTVWTARGRPAAAHRLTTLLHRLPTGLRPTVWRALRSALRAQQQQGCIFTGGKARPSAGKATRLAGYALGMLPASIPSRLAQRPRRGLALIGCRTEHANQLPRPPAGGCLAASGSYLSYPKLGAGARVGSERSQVRFATLSSPWSCVRTWRAAVALLRPVEPPPCWYVP